MSTPHQPQYSSIFPVDDRDSHPFTTVTVPLESNLRTNESHLARHMCKWNMCGQKFVEMEELVNHVNERHVILVEGEYCCKWEGCSRKGKGFNARWGYFSFHWAAILAFLIHKSMGFKLRPVSKLWFDSWWYLRGNLIIIQMICSAHITTLLGAQGANPETTGQAPSLSR